MIKLCIDVAEFFQIKSNKTFLNKFKVSYQFQHLYMVFIEIY